MDRTLDYLRNTHAGKVYVYLRDEETEMRFFANAEAEGYRFGQIRPSDSPPDDMIALERDKQLSHVGFVGRIAFQCGGSNHRGSFHRIDYAAYLRGNKDYYFH